MNSLTTLGELPRQYIPSHEISVQRQVLCLTNRGVHILKKMRPIDRLFQILSDENCLESREIHDFFDGSQGSEGSHGVEGVEGVCMCLAIVCGVPADAGGMSDTSGVIMR